MPQYAVRAYKFIVAFTLAFTVASCAPKPVAQGSELPSNLPIPTRQAIARVALLPSPYNSGDVSNGRALFNECAQCHTLERNGSETNGPNLRGIFQRRAAASEHYPFSEALRNSNIVWDVRQLDRWIFNPHEALPGTSMVYIGVRNDVKRHDLLAYLIAVSGDAESASTR